MKKILLLIALLIMLPITTQAAADVEIKNLTFLEKSEDTEIVQEATVSGLKLNFNLKFYNVGDKAKYKFTLKNNSTKDYEIETGTSFNKDRVIKYEFQVEGNSKVLKAKEEKIMTVTISYNTKVDESKYVDGKYLAEDTLNINLSNNKITANPKTANSKIIIGIIIMIIASTIAVLIYSQKQTFLPFVILILLLPVTTLALEKITINVDSKVEIEKVNVKAFDVQNDGYGINKDNISFEKGMTFDDFLDSAYANYLTNEERNNLVQVLNDSGSCHLYFADAEIISCFEQNPTDKAFCVTDENKVFEDSIIQDNTQGRYYIPLCK